MYSPRHLARYSLIASVCVFLSAGSSQAGLISGDGLLGHFTGTFTYSAVDATHANLVIDLTNTSPVANGGYITGFAFNNPSNYITGATLSSTNSNFQLLGGPGFSNGINGGPNGYFDIGASLDSNFQGSGPAVDGIGIGLNDTFTIAFTGTSLNTLTESTFFSALSVPPAAGEGVQSFVVRFRGFADGGSDKVVGELHSAPEPGTLALCGSGLMSLLGFGWFRRKGVAIAG